MHRVIASFRLNSAEREYVRQIAHAVPYSAGNVKSLAKCDLHDGLDPCGVDVRQSHFFGGSPHPRDPAGALHRRPVGACAGLAGGYGVEESAVDPQVEGVWRQPGYQSLDRVRVRRADYEKAVVGDGSPELGYDTRRFL